jgi:mono/diheme cytochrome c family protein
MRFKLPLLALAVAVAIVGIGASADLIAQQRQQVELPDDVKQFMERDQVRRWANMLEAGKKLYDEGSCMRCHGMDGKGTQRAPDLTDAEWVQSDGTLQGIRETIFWGVRRKDFADETRRFEMNPGGGMELEWAQYDDMAAYIWSLSNGTFLPER